MLAQDGKFAHTSIETDATTVEQEFEFILSWVQVIAHDGADGDLKINFDASTTSANTLTLKPGEVLQGFPKRCRKLYIRATSGTQAFRA